VDNYRIRVLDLSKVGYKDDPWIMANHSAQVFYAEQVLSPNDKKKITDHPKHIVFPGSNKPSELMVYLTWMNLTSSVTCLSL